jgi:predicted nucleic acid-binding protein
MPGPLTVDASVLINAFNPAEPHHADSNRLMAHVRSHGIPVIAPTLALPEVAAAIARTTGDSETAQRFAEQLRILPGLILVPLDETLALQSAQVAAENRLRGSDAVYGATALRFGSPLVTLDGEQLERLKPMLRTLTPRQALDDLGGPG